MWPPNTNLKTYCFHSLWWPHTFRKVRKKKDTARCSHPRRIQTSTMFSHCGGEVHLETAKAKKTPQDVATPLEFKNQLFSRGWQHTFWDVKSKRDIARCGHPTRIQNTYCVHSPWWSRTSWKVIKKAPQDVATRNKFENLLCSVTMMATRIMEHQK